MRKLAVGTTAILFIAALPVLATKAPPSAPPPSTDPPSLCDSISGNLVANCGFETGNFADWTQSGNLGFTGVDSGYAHTGNYGAYLGPVGSDGYLTQNVPTVAGHTYNLQWWLQSDGGFPNNFDVSLDGGVTEIFSSPYVPVQPYTNYSLDFVATGTTALQFSFQDNPGYLGLDDISIVPLTTVPEPMSVVLLVSLLAMVGVGLRRRIRHRLAN